MSNTFSDRKTSSLGGQPDAAPVEFSLGAYRSMGGIELTLSAELGRRTISVQELIRLQIDDIVALSRPTGENVDLLAGDILIGNAEILATDEKLAVRVADLRDKSASSTNRESGSREAVSLALPQKDSSDGR